VEILEIRRSSGKQNCTTDEFVENWNILLLKTFELLCTFGNWKQSFFHAHFQFKNCRFFIVVFTTVSGGFFIVADHHSMNCDAFIRGLYGHATCFIQVCTKSQSRRCLHQEPRFQQAQFIHGRVRLLLSQFEKLLKSVRNKEFIYNLQ